jgi:hypothetical protein
MERPLQVGDVVLYKRTFTCRISTIENGTYTLWVLKGRAKGMKITCRILEDMQYLPKFRI